MQISTRSVLMSGMATLTATAIALTPVQALPRDVAVPAADAIQQVPSQQVVDLLAAVQRLRPNPVADAAPGVGVQQAAPVPGLLAFPGLGNAIINVYNAVEPWVQYGFELAAYAVGWVPYVGWLAPQINIFYTFGEQIVRSITFNIADWISGDFTFAQGLVNVGVDTVNAFIYLANAELAFWLPPLPPIPPLPDICLFCNTLAATTLVDPVGSTEVGVTNAASDLVNAIYTPVSNTITYGVDVFQAALAPIPLVNIAGDQASILWNSLADPIADSAVYDLIDPVLNQPLNINSYLNGAYDVGATTVNSVIQTGIDEVNYFLGIPLLSQTGAQARELDRTAEIATVPSIVKNVLNGGRNAASGPTAGETNADGPLTEVRETVRDVRNVIRDATGRGSVGTTKTSVDAKNVGNEVVRAGSEVRGAVKKAADDITGALGAAKPGKSADAAAKTSTNVVKSIGDTARNVVKQVKEAAKNARDAVRDRPASDADE